MLGGLQTDIVYCELMSTPANFHVQTTGLCTDSDGLGSAVAESFAKTTPDDTRPRPLQKLKPKTPFFQCLITAKAPDALAYIEEPPFAAEEVCRNRVPCEDFLAHTEEPQVVEDWEVRHLETIRYRASVQLAERWQGRWAVQSSTGSVLVVKRSDGLETSGLSFVLSIKVLAFFCHWQVILWHLRARTNNLSSQNNVFERSRQ